MAKKKTSKINPKTKIISKRAYSKVSVHHTKKKANIAAKSERKRSTRTLKVSARVIPSTDKRFKKVVYIRRDKR